MLCVAPIAIVDDELTMVEMLELLLALEGYQTVSALSSAAAEVLIREHCPVLVVLDLRFPDGPSGWEVLDRLRADSVTARLPVVICSADHDTALPVATRADPSLMIVPKPFRAPVLLTAIRGLLGSEHAAAR